MNCHFDSLAKGAKCLHGCGRVLKMNFSQQPTVPCEKKSGNGLMAGDAIENLLASYGITKEWWTEYKSQHGLPPTCGCDSRREYLNNLSKAHPNLAKYGVMVFRALTRNKP